MMQLTPLAHFLHDLERISQKLAPSTYAFCAPNSSQTGILQLGHCRENQISIHRLWATPLGLGHGSRMLRAICQLADVHRLEIALKVLPFGAKPYPMDKAALAAWYERHGFAGTRWNLLRRPATI
jgi:hypothetical protein